MKKQLTKPNEAQHTQGTWKKCIQPDGIGMVTTINSGTTRLATLSNIKETTENGHLMAAAPDMLKALEYYVNGLSHFFNKINWAKSFLDADAIQFMNDHEIKIRQAIRKAKGQ